VVEGKRAFALVIGINDYLDGVPKLGNARQDAEAVAEQLGTRPHDYEVSLLRDGEATRDAIRGYFETLPASLSQESRFLLYFAGHGVALPGDETTGPQGSLLMHDAKLEDPASWLDMGELRNDLLGRLKDHCRHVLVVLDCCHAGAFATATRGVEFVKRRPLYESQYERYLETQAWQALTSASADERAVDSVAGFADRRGAGDHSPFAAALIEGLAGGADASSSRFVADGVITATELYLYIRSALTPVAGPAEQTPQIWPLEATTKGEFVFRNPKIEPRFETDPDLEKTPNPWRGLAAYTQSAEDAELFFGRSDAVDELLARVTRPGAAGSLLAVVGASGTGKSSLVRAGLLPLLTAPADDRRDGVGDWAIVESARLSGDPNAQLDDAKKQLDAAPAGTRRLLLVDQFEELFTRCPDTDARTRFLESVRTLIAAPDGATVVLTLRSDFDARAADGALKDRWEDARYQVPPFTTDELRQVIEGPAGRRAIGFDPPELVGKLVDEVNTMPGALPLLSFALAEMYRQLQRRWQDGERNRAISKDDYDTVGGVVGGLNRSASKLYDEATESEQEATRRIFLRLVAREGAGLTRRRVDQDELRFGDDGDEQQQHIDAMRDRYVDAGLLVLDGEYVEPAHDALVLEWQYLHEWLEQSDSQDVIRAAWPAASDWRDRGKAGGSLWDRNPRLPLLKVSRSELNVLEREFLAASVRRRRNRTLRLIAITAAVMLALIAASVITFWQRNQAIVQHNDARRATARASSSALASAANQQLGSHLDRALLLGLAAYDSSPGAEARNALVTALESARSTGVEAILRDLPGVRGVALAPDAPTLAWWGGGGTVHLWNLRTGRSPGELSTPGPVATVAFVANGDRIAVVGKNGEVRLFNAESRQPAGKPVLPGGAIASATVSPDGGTVAVVDRGGRVTLWRVRDGARLGRLPGKADPAPLAFSPDGRMLATATTYFAEGAFETSQVKLWRVSSRTRFRTLGFEDSALVDVLAFSSDGRTLATGGHYDNSKYSTPQAGHLEIWDLRHRGAATTLPWPSSVLVTALAFSPDGRRLAAGRSDGTILLAYAAHPKSDGTTLSGVDGAVTSLAVSRDGRSVAALGAGEPAIHVWDLGADSAFGRRLVFGQGRLMEAAIATSPDQSTVALGDSTGRVTLVRIASGRATVHPLHLGPIRTMAYGPDGTLAIGTDSGCVALWHVGDGPAHCERKIPAHGEVTSLAFSPAGSTLAVGSLAGTLLLYDVTGRRPPVGPVPVGGTALALAFTEDGRVASAGTDGTVRLWDATRLDQRARQAVAPASESAAFSPDGSTVAFGTGVGTVWLATVGDASSAGVLPGAFPLVSDGPTPGRDVASVAFAPDGATVAAGSLDETRIWDVAARSPLGRPLQEHHPYGEVTAVAFGLDGGVLETASDSVGSLKHLADSSSLRLWKHVLWGDPAGATREVCSLVVGDLLPTEWAALAPGKAYRTTCPG
jgi:WD40 repeat protein